MSKGIRIPATEAKELADKISQVLKKKKLRFTVCGSVRRGTLSTVGDLDIVVYDLEKAWTTIHDHSNWYGMPLPPTTTGKLRKFVVIEKLFPIPISLYQAYDEEWGAMILFLTGNFLFNIQMRAVAKKEGMKLNQYGLFLGENVISGKTEPQIFEALGLPFIEPKDREYTQKDKLWSLRR